MKSHLRHKYKNLRLSLSEKDLASISLSVFSQLRQNFENSFSKCVHVFLPIHKQREINTWPIIEWLWEKEIKVIVSISDLERPVMTHYFLDPETIVSPNKWGIPEPVNAKKASIATIGAVLVPLLCFDCKGHRIGYGKGYYDRFLAQCPNNTLKIGLSHFEEIEENIEPGASDITLDYSVSPSKLYKFRL